MGWPIKIKKQEPEPTPHEKSLWPIQPGEYIPWKGFMFQVTEVTKTGFTAQIAGVTKKLAHLVKK